METQEISTQATETDASDSTFFSTHTQEELAYAMLMQPTNSIFKHVRLIGKN